MTFELNLLPLAELDHIMVDDKRLYETPNGNYPSVTTVLSATTDNSAIDAWRARVGAEAADAKTKRSTDRGTVVHSMCEDYIQGKEQNLSEKMPFLVDLFVQIKKVLDNDVSNVMGIESALYSDIYKVAGRCDLIADFRGVPSIIDYKTSDKVKREDWIENYFLQSSLYSYMLWEMTGVVTKQIVLLIAIEDSNMCQVIVKKPSQYIAKAISLVKKYHEQASQQS